MLHIVMYILGIFFLGCWIMMARDLTHVIVKHRRGRRLLTDQRPGASKLRKRALR
jgi:hypothetical protein